MENTDFGGIKFDMPKNQSNVIKVIGVGGGGSNAINHMFKQGIKGVDFIVCNTDSQALENSSVPNKIQLGVNLTEGLGAGANPEVGQQSALESIEEIEKMLDTNTKMVFITAGMGGGTGTGAAPVIAQLSKERDILTVGIVTIPFQFEGKVRQEQALKGVDRLRKQVDSLIVINNNKLREVYGNLGFKAGFSKADEVLSTAARGIAEVITHHYTQNIDLKDAKTVLSDSGTAIMGSGTASGDNRAKDAIIDALDSPLLNDNKISGAKNVLLLIVSGTNEITIDEIGEINDHIQTEAGHNANIIMGVGEDESLGEAISVTIIATGFNYEQQKSIVNSSEPKVIIHTLEEEQKVVRDLTQTAATPSFGFTTPDQPLRVSTPESAQEIETEEVNPPVETRKVFTLEDDYEEDDQQDDFGGSAFPTQPTGEIEELAFERKATEASNLDVFFEIVTPKTEARTSDQVNNDPTAFKQKDIRDIQVFDPEFVIVTPKVQESAAPIVHHFTDELEEMEMASAEASSHANEAMAQASAKKEEIIRFSLEDYMDKEEELSLAKPVSTHKEEIAEEFKFSVRAEDAPVVNKVEVEASADDYDEMNPTEMSIEEFTLRSRAAERRRKMKDFNYKFNNSTAHYSDLEKEPAYKRLGVDLDEVNEENNKSRISFGVDGNNDPKLRSNNSFLHDNVD
ncbi:MULTISPECIES: cell division protein FtsZ [unclassified Myroides]|uniref:cell division protein FtsZ n=1 Tax=unclassified Myroides TaxID=2642485 RepID=UPI0015F9352D|nr:MULTISPECIES: cell division protein FtsZ [unclassified Myroides]MBB1150546.1 cell division protein FtsZ [Myroides sp. NP-2]MDM1407223.1 cell division protein FtsZ [Myroides sp. DF42-4-2]